MNHDAAATDRGESQAGSPDPELDRSKAATVSVWWVCGKRSNTVKFVIW
jgi:hypothetical protein